VFGTGRSSCEAAGDFLLSKKSRYWKVPDSLCFVRLRLNEPANSVEVQRIPVEQFEELRNGDCEALHCEEHVPHWHFASEGRQEFPGVSVLGVPCHICWPVVEAVQFGNGPAMIGRGSDASQDFSQ